METLKSYLPAIIRYLIVTAATSFATRGWISPESGAILSQSVDALVGAIIVLLTVAYALIVRPSAKAMTAAKEIDAKISKKDDVVIKTPGAAPDIVVPATPTK